MGICLYQFFCACSSNRSSSSGLFSLIDGFHARQFGVSTLVSNCFWYDHFDTAFDTVILTLIPLEFPIFHSVSPIQSVLFPTRERVRPTVNLILLLCTSSTQTLHEMTSKIIHTKYSHHDGPIIDGAVVQTIHSFCNSS